MKISVLPSHSLRTPLMFLFLLFVSSNSFPQQEDLAKEATDYDPEAIHTVEVVSTGMNFILPEEIPSGWITFLYQNQSPDIHFFVLEKMPEGKTIADTRAEIIPVFSEAMDLITAGNRDQGMAVFDNLPTWFFDVVFRGGAGLISPGKTAQTTLLLSPGNYVLECYVKMPNGMFHSAMGMIEQVTVTENTNSGTAPQASHTIRISGERGIEIPEEVRTGRQTFEVQFEDQKVHENFVGHDVHLVKLGEQGTVEGLEAWMNWADPTGLISPGPEGISFLGGTQEMPAGETAYFTVTMEPGNYAFIAETPAARQKNMLKTFFVSAE